MKMRWILLLVIVPIVVACRSEGERDAGSEAEAKGVASAPSGRDDGDDFKWRVEYSGDLQGQVGGSIMSVGGFASNTIIQGAAMNADSTGAAEHRFGATITQYGDEPTTSFNLTLADGTRCFDVTADDPQPSSVDIADPERDSFRAEIEGTLHCGTEKDKRIDFTAYLDADR